MDSGTDWSTRLRDLFDEFAGQEWDRLDKDARSRAAFEIHRRFLSHFVSPGERVLEIGAGPGRFTIELGRIGCRVVVTDISPVQLDLNAQRLEDAHLAHVVEDRYELDVTDLSTVPDQSFDAIVALGGPLSYAFERAAEALSAMVRAVKPGGHVVASVMDLPGTLRFFLAAVPEYDAAGRLDVLKRVVDTGDNRLDPPAHPCRLFTWTEIERIIRPLPCQIVGASASNFLTCGDQETVEAIHADPPLWAQLLDWEERMCTEPGALDGGTHVLFAVRHT